MTLNNLTKDETQGMQVINGSIEEGVVAVPWLLGAREDELDLEIIPCFPLVTTTGTYWTRSGGIS